MIEKELVKIQESQEAKKCDELQKVLLAVDEVMKNTALLDNIKNEKELNQVMPELLASLGNYAQADRSYIFEFKSGTREVLHMTHVWYAEGIFPTISKMEYIPLSCVPNWFSILNNDGVIVFYNCEMEIAKEEGALCGFHAENNDIAQFLKNQLLSEGKTDWEYFNEAKPNICEAEAVNRILSFAELLDAPVYFYHLSTKEAVELVRQAKKRGVKVQAETCGHYLVFTKKENKGKDGINYLMSPPLRSQEDQDALWEGINDGTLSLVTSDNEIFTRKIKEKDLETDPKTGEKIPNFATPVNGIPGLEERFGLLMRGVNEGKISLNKLVEVGSTNPAKVFGCYPEKGCLAVGSDADIIIVDPEKVVSLTQRNMHYTEDGSLDYDIYKDMEAKGWPVYTIRRGEILVEDGKFYGKDHTGKFLKCHLN